MAEIRKHSSQRARLQPDPPGSQVQEPAQGKELRGPGRARAEQRKGE